MGEPLYSAFELHRKLHVQRSTCLGRLEATWRQRLESVQPPCSVLSSNGLGGVVHIASSTHFV